MIKKQEKKLEGIDEEVKGYWLLAFGYWLKAIQNKHFLSLQQITSNR